MMPVIVIACASFGLTAPEDKTEIMCLQTKDGEEVYRSTSLLRVSCANKRSSVCT